MEAEVNERTSVFKAGGIVAFPLEARTGEIDRCARELDRVHGNAALQFWKTECRKLADELLKLGLGEDQIRSQVLAFQAEVQAAIARRYEAPAVERNRSDSRT
ncbi:hypothetical protein N181_02930 [Sinorhizobium fredii USDA 205]|uniref:Uncharacterized protein n=2 Tax=Rhizobium fredii TaxID=380 RepID=A0A844A5L0_RHIFR|nr:DUF6074 family protein [Sinorhizobium fredii]KSV86101.1 hypothetical protein N181_02930 [Sinorhizobium fredii USDA 205]MQX07797.1 hypothetical protein [Sinorhizobium fredii]CCE99811.1 conserved hypothetical protein [Sinorhizobium fredii HH103]GEC33343.1 hypothetical protein EFR01_35140 [Sinorhizobium fredii]GLS07645.1 hypothetical protein GCM10007864_12720 [Sinorhizobium fredii]